MYDAVGVALEVHGTLGRGMAEQVYQEAYAIESRLRDMPVEREKVLHLSYLFNFGEKNLHTERYLYWSAEDRFVLLTHDNYKLYITD